MTEQEKIDKVADKVTEYTTATMHNQGLISYNDIPKLATEIVKNLGLFSVSNNEVAVCETCKTPLQLFNDGRPFCPSCLKIYKAN